MKTVEVVEHVNCRLCKSDKLTNVFSLGEQFINNFVEQDQVEKGIKAPLDLVKCQVCSLVQLKHTAPQELLYSRHYWYRSGVTQTMRDALLDLYKSIVNKIELNCSDVILDIGANDGTLLQYFKNNGYKTVGCEPAINLVEQLRGNCDLIINDFWSKELYLDLSKKYDLNKARVITAIGMFYDLEDPSKFISDIKDTLADDGLFVAQLMCLDPMLKKNDLGNICHEHIEYYSYKSLVYLYENNGLEIFDIEENLVNGGSLRIYARHKTNGSISYQDNSTLDELLAFKSRVDLNKDKCLSFINEEVKKGKVVYVYGASTKGNVILQYYGLNNDLITAAAERSPEKWGKYTIGTGIKIVSEEEARKANPDYFLVLPWAFLDEFYDREKEWRMRGGKFIVPLPEFRVIS